MRLYYGVDLGGTTVKLGLFSGDGELLEKWEIPTRKEGNGAYVFDDIAAAILQKTEAVGGVPGDIEAVGMGLPGPLQEDGYLEVCVNIGLRDVYPAQELSKRLNHIPVRCGNDANVAALGEAWKGGGKGYGSMVLLTLGTGVGGGVVIGGEVVTGAHGIAGEIGHLPVRPEETETCNCGGRGCLEQVASATGIVREARRVLARTGQDSVLRSLHELTAKDVLDAAKAGDGLAVSVMETVANYLGLAMAQISYVVDPDVFVIGGGVSRAGEYLLDVIRPAYESRIFLTAQKADLALARLGNDAGIYGAVRLVLGI